uniref:Cellulase n=1 Tax=Leptinotarsa decemlineata TaxID=7539 RepID=A0A4D6Q2X9_LEPDE|nr:glycoside hydrolase family 45 protein [Leptinotarsa decemlineata]
MKLIVLSLAILAAFDYSTSEYSPTIIPINGGREGDGITTRYWDCCAPSCAWDQIIHTKNRKPVQTCKIDGRTNSTVEQNAQSGCYDGGVAYMCSNQVAWVVNSTLAYGFSAASFTGGVDTDQCCICVLLSFKGQLTGKKFLVQITNTGSPLAVNQFDLAMPGGGVGIFEKGCSSQWGTPPWGWGRPVGGVEFEEECNQLPADLQEGCRFRFQFMENVDNPDVSFIEVQCPAELKALTGCGD